MRRSGQNIRADKPAIERNSRALFDERGRFVGYLVEIEGRAPFLTTKTCEPSFTHIRHKRTGATVVNKAHAARLRAADRIGARGVAGTEAAAAS